MALRLVSVPVAQYPLVFGKGMLDNLAAFLAWSAGFSQTLLTVKLGLDAGATYPTLQPGLFWLPPFGLARDRRLAVFAAIWFIIALQPVLYFWQHIDAYYLAPALSALAILIAATLPEPCGIRDWRALLPAAAIVCYTLWLAPVSVRLEGRWWNERAMRKAHH